MEAFRNERKNGLWHFVSYHRLLLEFITFQITIFESVFPLLFTPVNLEKIILMYTPSFTEVFCLKQPPRPI
jgi:hypothetical protein